MIIHTTKHNFIRTHIETNSMESLLTTAATYAGELIIAGVALLVRGIEKKMIIRRKRREWESGK